MLTLNIPHGEDLVRGSGKSRERRSHASWRLGGRRLRRRALPRHLLRYCDRKDWTTPGSLLILRKRDSLYTFWDGVFLELRRRP